MVKKYIPNRGDIIMLNFNHQSGKEQAGKRPALVLSPSAYNERVGLALCCPITSQIKGYPFEVLLPEKLPVQGVILSDHVKSLDWKIRQAKFICSVPVSILDEVMAKLSVIIRI
jgi:mRNA interferase MazF